MLMSKFLVIAVTAALGLAGCAQPRDAVPITVTHEGGRTVDVQQARAKDDARTSAAGGSHAPGSTGLGAGTMGTEGPSAR